MKTSPSSDQAKLTDGPIGSTLLHLTLPMIVSIVSMVAFNLIDTYYIGHLGTRELAAISFTFPVVFVISGLTMGMGIGASAVISRAIGEGNQEKVRRLTTDSLILGLMITALFIGLGLFFFHSIFSLLGADIVMRQLIFKYMRIWLPGMIFLVIPMVGNNAIRATGDTKTPSLIMLIAVVVNAVLDPLFIFGIGPFPRLELAGAALATISARTLTMIVSLYVLIGREKMVSFVWPSLKSMYHSWKYILYIGLPAGATNIIIPVGTGILTRMLSGYGPEVVAAFGIGTRIDMFALTVIMALATALAPFVGQNLGAGRHCRVRRSIALSQRFSLIWGFFMAVLLIFFRGIIARQFNADPSVIKSVQIYLQIVPIGYGMQGIFILSTRSMNVLHRPLPAAGMNVLRMFGCFIPLAIMGNTVWGFQGVFLANPLTNILSGLAVYFWLKRLLCSDNRGLK
ncbi:MATE family efflux transporter [bacterium]|nr:MATE family efflux transporter [bacterium]